MSNKDYITEVNEFWKNSDKYELNVLFCMIHMQKSLISDLQRVTRSYSSSNNILSFDEVNILKRKVDEYRQYKASTTYSRLLADYISSHKRITKKNALLIEYLIVYEEFQKDSYQMYYKALEKAVKHADVKGSPLPEVEKFANTTIDIYGQSLSEMLSTNAEYYMRKLTDEAVRANAAGKDDIPKNIYEKIVSSARKDILNQSNKTGNLYGIFDRIYLYEIGKRRIDELVRLGVEKVRFVAVLDNATTDECRSLNGFTFKVKDLVIGKNAPPIYPPPHPCRSRLVPIK